MEQLRLRLPQALLAVTPFGEIAQDLRGTDDGTGFIVDRRYRQRDGKSAAVLPLPHGFVMLDLLAVADAVEDHRIFRHPVGREQHDDRLADDLPGAVTEHRLGGAVPMGDDAVQVLADDRIVGRFDDRRQPANGADLRLLEAKVVVDLDDPPRPAIRKALQRPIAGDGQLAAVPRAVQQFAMPRAVRQQRGLHRRERLREPRCQQLVRPPADGLMRRPAVQPLGRGAPEADGSVQVAHDRWRHVQRRQHILDVQPTCVGCCRWRGHNSSFSATMRCRVVLGSAVQE